MCHHSRAGCDNHGFSLELIQLLRDAGVKNPVHDQYTGSGGTLLHDLLSQTGSWYEWADGGPAAMESLVAELKLDVNQLDKHGSSPLVLTLQAFGRHFAIFLEI